MKILHQGWPADTGLNLDRALNLIELQDTVQRARVDKHAIGEELLATARMAPAAETDGLTLAARLPQHIQELAAAGRRRDAAHVRAVKL